MGKVEGRVEDLGRETNQGLADVQGEVSTLRDQHERGMRRLARLEAGGDVEDGDVDGDGESGDAKAGPPAQVNAGRRSSPRLRREFPELVTVDPADDDEEVFGDACPLVQEWRGLKQTHPNRGKGLEWLRTEERLLAVELGLLEDHGLTLPPETYPLKGLDRSGQTNWRRKALDETRKAGKRGELLLWLRRALTLGLWRK